MTLDDGDFGEVQHYFIDKNRRVLAVILPLAAQCSSFCDTLKHYIVPVLKKDRVIIKNVKHITRKCVLVQINDSNTMYVCRIPNFIETD